jgi:hypothetical protein
VSVIRVAIDIAAPSAVCFDLARSVDAHARSARVDVLLQVFLEERARVLKGLAESQECRRYV